MKLRCAASSPNSTLLAIAEPKSPENAAPWRICCFIGIASSLPPVGRADQADHKAELEFFQEGS
jgi:hypothetical protein